MPPRAPGFPRRRPLSLAWRKGPVPPPITWRSTRRSARSWKGGSPCCRSLRAPETWTWWWRPSSSKRGAPCSTATSARSAPRSSHRRIESMRRPRRSPGAMAGSGVLPVPREACEQAIRNAGRGAEASLRGFAAGHDIAAAKRRPPEEARPPRRATALQDVLDLGVARLKDYQGDAYAELFLKRLKPFLESDAGLAAAVGRHLAVWMSYEDVIRVADLKSRASRFERVRREVGAKPGEPVVIVDYLKPGLEEFASILPATLGRRLIAWAERKGKLAAY